MKGVGKELSFLFISHPSSSDFRRPEGKGKKGREGRREWKSMAAQFLVASQENRVFCRFPVSFPQTLCGRPRTTTSGEVIRETCDVA